MFKLTGKSKKAYELGKQAYVEGKSIDDNPYILASKIHFRNWWAKGYDEYKKIENQL